MSDFASPRRAVLPLAFGLTLAAVISGGRAMAAEATSKDLETLFESKVRPLLTAKCQRCHGDKLAEAGLRLDSRRSMLAGSDTGPVVVPGDAAKSRLVAAVRHADGLCDGHGDRVRDADARALGQRDGLPDAQQEGQALASAGARRMHAPWSWRNGHLCMHAWGSGRGTIEVQ